MTLVIKLLFTADTLSRAATTRVATNSEDVAMKVFVQAVVASLPASQLRLEEYRQGQQNDDICSQAIIYFQSEWPSRGEVSKELMQYWTVGTELLYVDGLLLYRNRIVVPKKLQRETLQKIHSGHQGIFKCCERVLTSVWWPGVLQQLKDFIKTCVECLQTASLTREPLLQTPLPNHPWERVGADLYQFKGSVNLVVVDYFSRYVEIQKMTSTTASKVITALKQYLLGMAYQLS